MATLDDFGKTADRKLVSGRETQEGMGFACLPWGEMGPQNLVKNVAMKVFKE